MISFLLISQRAEANPNFKLNDLPGHGRLDIVIRAIISASINIVNQKPSQIYCFLKGSMEQGWLYWNHEIDTDDDEISVASKLQSNWTNYFYQGTLDELMKNFETFKIILLTESGSSINDFTFEQNENYLVVLGAQKDLQADDLSKLKINQYISLGERSILASQAITLFRQIYVCF